MSAKNKIVTALMGLITAAMITTGANASPFNFSYQTSAYTVSGQMDGTLLGDGDTVLLSSISNIQIDGFPTADFPFLSTPEELDGYSGFFPVASLSGLLVDFIACDSPMCYDGFLIDTFYDYGSPAFASGPSFDYLMEGYDPENWSMAPAAVPEPASLALLGLGLAALVTFRRRLFRLNSER